MFRISVFLVYHLYFMFRISVIFSDCNRDKMTSYISLVVEKKVLTQFETRNNRRLGKCVRHDIEDEILFCCLYLPCDQ